MGKKWVPLESNPQVMTDLAQQLGVDITKFSFHDVFGLDEVRWAGRRHDAVHARLDHAALHWSCMRSQELLAMVPQPIKALLMCFPVSDEIDAAAKQGALGSTCTWP
jgi:ubiquitin carboxyl-terminal hydrolase L3